MALVITFPFSPILAQLGPISIRWYGLGYAVAFLAGLWLVGKHLRRYGLTERDYGDLAFWSIVIGLIAARLYYVVQSGFGWYLTHPQHILAFWEGGMAYFGAVFTVPIFVLLYVRRKKLPLWPVLDAAALFAAIGQPIGRIGNIFNGDVIGFPSDLPWAIRYTSPDTFAPQLGTAYQPAAAYELLLGLVILGILFLIRDRIKPKPGALFATYLTLYAVSQFGIFFLRDNEIVALGLKQAQLSAIFLFAVSIAVWYLWNRFSEPVPEVAAATATAAVAEAPTGGGAETEASTKTEPGDEKKSEAREPSSKKGEAPEPG